MPGAMIDFSAGRTGISPTDGTQGFAGLGDALQAIAQRRHAMAVVKLQQEQEKQMQAERLAAQAAQQDAEREARAAEKEMLAEQRQDENFDKRYMAGLGHRILGNTPAYFAAVRAGGGRVDNDMGADPGVPNPLQGPTETGEPLEQYKPPTPGESFVFDQRGRHIDTVGGKEKLASADQRRMMLMQQAYLSGLPPEYMGPVLAAVKGAEDFTPDTMGEERGRKEVQDAIERQAALKAAADREAARRKGRGDGKGDSGLSLKEAKDVQAMLINGDKNIAAKQKMGQALRAGRQAFADAKAALASGKSRLASLQMLQGIFGKLYAATGAAFNANELSAGADPRSLIESMLSKMSTMAGGADAGQLSALEEQYGQILRQMERAAEECVANNSSIELVGNGKYNEFARRKYRELLGLDSVGGGAKPTSAQANVPPKPGPGYKLQSNKDRTKFRWVKQ